MFLHVVLNIISCYYSIYISPFFVPMIGHTVINVSYPGESKTRDETRSVEFKVTVKITEVYNESIPHGGQGLCPGFGD